MKSLGANITEIIEIGEDLHIKEHYENKDLEMYKSLIPLVQKSTIPERLDPKKVEIEEDLCMLEQDMEFRIDNASKSIDELKRHCKELIDSSNENMKL